MQELKGLTYEDAAESTLYIFCIEKSLPVFMLIHPCMKCSSQINLIYIFILFGWLISHLYGKDNFKKEKKLWIQLFLKNVAPKYLLRFLNLEDSNTV